MIVNQITARRDYAVPKIFYKSGMLSKFFTDSYYDYNKIWIFRLLDKILPSKVVKTYKRYNSGIPIELICYNWYLALSFKFKIRFNILYSKSNVQIGIYKSLCNSIINYCIKNPTIKSYYGFDTSSLEFFVWAKPKGFSLFLDQCVAPRISQIRMYEYFETKYGTNESTSIQECLIMKKREEMEWELADKILVPSQYVKDQLIEAGADQSKIFLVPFGYDSTVLFEVRKDSMRKRFLRRNPSDNVVKVFFAGNAGIRKGVLDILDISRTVPSNVHFYIAGHPDSYILNEANKSNYSNVFFLGKLPLPDLHEQYKNSDIFFFPSYLEGSARVIFEAMSWGLPILTSYQTGSVVSNGKEGFLCSAGDLNDFREKLLLLISNEQLRKSMGEAALETCEYFSLDRYSNNLISVILS